MIHLLMCQPAIILQHIVVLGTHHLGDLAHYGEHFSQLVVGNVSQVAAMVFGDDEGMAFGEGLDVKEGEDGGGLEELEGGDVAWRRLGW